MTARGTDWSLALLVALLVATGLLTAFAGSPGSAWVFALHGALGFGVAVVLVWKGRRVWRRVADPARWDGRTGFGLVAAALVLGALASGFLWSGGADVRLGGFGLLNWHWALGAALGLLVLVHALLRAKRPRARDVTDRRQLWRWAPWRSGSSSGQCRRCSDYGGRAGASPAPTRRRRLPATPSRRPRGWPIIRASCPPATA